MMIGSALSHDHTTVVNQYGGGYGVSYGGGFGGGYGGGYGGQQQSVSLSLFLSLFLVHTRILESLKQQAGRES